MWAGIHSCALFFCSPALFSAPCFALLHRIHLKDAGAKCIHPDALSGMYSFLREGEFVKWNFERREQAYWFHLALRRTRQRSRCIYSITFAEGRYTPEAVLACHNQTGTQRMV